MANYELWYTDDLGNRLQFVNDVRSFEYVEVLGDVGLGVFQFPKRNQVYDNRQADRRIVVYRQAIGGTLTRKFTCILRKFDITTSLQGQYTLDHSGGGLNELLRRRIVAYFSKSATARKTDYADNIMKDIVTDNFVSNADYSGTPSPTRTMQGISVASDLSDGPTISIGYAWQNALDALQEIQATSKGEGNEVFFGLVALSDTSSVFTTWTEQPGMDRTVSTGVNPLIFSLEYGNLSSPHLTYDYSEEVNYVYIGGEGARENRIINVGSDTSGINRSQIGRREGFETVETESDMAYVIQPSYTAITLQRPKITFTGDISSVPLTPYGGIGGWNLGDKVTISYAGLQFDTIIRAVHVKVDSRGQETVKTKVEYES